MTSHLNHLKYEDFLNSRHPSLMVPWMGAIHPAAGGAGAGGFAVDNSAMFNDDDSEYLNRTFGTPTSAAKFTISLWFKRGNMGISTYLLDEGTGGFGFIRINADDTLTYYNEASGVAIQLITNQVFRDPHAWYHLVIQQDTTQSTSTNRAKMWVNGTQVTSFSTAQYNIAQNDPGTLNTAVAHAIGHSGSNFWDGYLSEYVLCDGQAYVETDFGEYSSEGVWRPKDVSELTFGNNGFYLPFTNSAGLGQDYSGSTAESKVQENTYASGSEVNKTDMTNAGFTAGVKFTAVASAALPTVKIRASSTGFSSVTVRIETDGGSGNAPSGTLVDSNSEVTGITSSGAGLKTADFPNGGPVLTAGTLYWIVLANAGNWGWQHDVSGSGGALGIRDASGYQAGRGLGHEVYQVGNIFTPVNSPTQTTDTPTTNFATLTTIDTSPAIFSNGNLKVTSSTSNSYRGGTSSIGLPPGSGKWYCEALATGSTGSNKEYGFGAVTNDTNKGVSGYFPGSYGSGTEHGYYSGSGGIIYNTPNSSVTSVGTYNGGDRVALRFDMDVSSPTCKFYVNDTLKHTANLTAGETYFPHFNVQDSNLSWTVNFGATAFTYSLPTDHLAISAANLNTALTPAIKDGTAHFQTSLYSGNGSTQTITQSGFNSTFQPDLIWGKQTTGSQEPTLFDAVRGTTKYVQANSIAAEATQSGVTAFNSDGFALGSWAVMNQSSNTHVAWQWLAGNSTSSNGNGSITSTVSANQTAGFSIVSWTGTGANATIGHGLGAVPEWILVKNRDSAGNNWPVYHVGQGNTHVSFLDSNAIIVAADRWQDTTPTSTVFSVDGTTDVNKLNDKMIAYCWAGKPGFSKFGTYVGNGNADGPFIEMGFSPSWVMLKRISGSTASWVIYDNVRDPSNAADRMQIVETAAADNVGNEMDWLSNGIKIKGTSGAYNGSSNTYIYMAFAENPFAGLTPSTAR